MGLHPVLIGFRFVHLISGRLVPDEWLRRLEERQAAHDVSRRLKAERIRRKMQAGRKGVL